MTFRDLRALRIFHVVTLLAAALFLATMLLSLLLPIFNYFVSAFLIKSTSELPLDPSDLEVMRSTGKFARTVGPNLLHLVYALYSFIGFLFFKRLASLIKLAKEGKSETMLASILLKKLSRLLLGIFLSSILYAGLFTYVTVKIPAVDSASIEAFHLRVCSKIGEPSKREGCLRIPKIQDPKLTAFFDPLLQCLFPNFFGASALVLSFLFYLVGQLLEEKLRLASEVNRLQREDHFTI